MIMKNEKFENVKKKKKFPYARRTTVGCTDAENERADEPGRKSRMCEKLHVKHAIFRHGSSALCEQRR